MTGKRESMDSWEKLHPSYRVWKGMMHRCGHVGTSWTPKERRFIEEGITVAPEWRTFEAFERWIASTPWKPRSRMVVTRLDKSLGYTPENCVVMGAAESQKLKRNVFKTEAERSTRKSSYHRRWLSEHPLYPTWCGIKRNCGLQRGASEYTLRIYSGVTVCPEWADDYAAFERWALDHGWEKGLQVARLDKNGDYEPSNCIVTTWDENVNLRRNTLRHGGVPLRKIIGVPTAGRLDRLYKRAEDRYRHLGWDVASAVARGVVPPAEIAANCNRIRRERV